MKKYAIIVAGGLGKRMGTPEPKQFLLLNGKPVLWYTLDVFLRSYNDLNIILVLPEGYESKALSIATTTISAERIIAVKGGETRFLSVKNGLALVPEGSMLFVHDAVRCLLSTSLVHRCYETALEFGSAIPVIDSKDSVRLLSGKEHRALLRSSVKLVQTPQTFLSSNLISAFKLKYQESFTDEASVLEAAGFPLKLVEGEIDNFKITSPADLKLAELLLSNP